jgi:hypothetical protein
VRVMAESQKIEELFAKVRSIADKAKSTRAQLGEPILDRILSRANRTLTRLGDGNGMVQQPQPQTPLKVCPKCGRPFFEDVSFCNCGFSFQEEKRRQQREEIEREKLERGSRMGVVS